jgi:hypothetical protein
MTHETKRDRQQAFDVLMIRALTRFATSQGTAVTDAIAEAVREITALFGADHGYLLTFTDDLSAVEAGTNGAGRASPPSSGTTSGHRSVSSPGNSGG